MGDDLIANSFSYLSSPHYWGLTNKGGVIIRDNVGGYACRLGQSIDVDLYSSNL
jgi:hypothetical protein